VIKKKLSSELRKIQAFFHPDIIDQILQINSLKSHSALENGTTAGQTWSALADLYNNEDPDLNLDDIDYSNLFDNNNHLINNSGYQDLLLTVTNFTETASNGDELKKFFTSAFKLRRSMKTKMMTVSGSHKSDPLSYVDRAKKTVKNVSAIHRLALYYFCVKC
jgi:hypothetical protein